jgi:hypothetical protein
LILLYAALAGLLASLLRAWAGKRPLQVPDLRLTWLVILVFLPQFFTFYLPLTRKSIPDKGASIALAVSQVIFLFFAWANRRQPGFWILGLGLLLNLAVILPNGGWMPITPQTVSRIYPDSPTSSWRIGERLGTSKDIVLRPKDIRLEWLSDRFVLPVGPKAAFSFGDVLISIGAFWFCWNIGSANRTQRPDRSPPAPVTH